MKKGRCVSGTFEIRTMNQDDLEFAIDLAAREGWNPGLHDAETFFQADPQGFFIGEMDNEPVGCVSGVAYPEDFGFVGLYIMLPEHRGKGLGIRLWNQAMEYLRNENRTIGLDGVVDQQDNYRKSGFRLAYRNVRYQGRGVFQEGGLPRDVVALNRVPLAEVESYDRLCFPSARPEFLRAWLGQPDSHGYGLLRGSCLHGLGLIRKCSLGWKIGPLFADDRSAAESLFQALASRVPGEPIFLDTPEPNLEAVALARAHGMEIVFETARMYAGPDPDVDMGRMFGVTTFELG